MNTAEKIGDAIAALEICRAILKQALKGAPLSVQNSIKLWLMNLDDDRDALMMIQKIANETSGDLQISQRPGAA